MQMSHNKLQQFATDTLGNSSRETGNQIFPDHSFHFLSDENRRIQHVTHKTLECLVKEVGDADSDFRGTLVGVGSFFDGTRVGTAPNEFDYIFVLKELSNSISKVQRTGTAEYRLQIQSDPTNACTWLSNILLRDRLCTLIARVMDTIVLPEDLHHGGILSPCFSGIRKNGPAFTLLFAWTGGSYTETPLLIRVDITVAVRPAHLERYAGEEATLKQLLKPLGVKNHGGHQTYLIAHPNRDDVWLMTSAALDVSIMHHVYSLSNRCVRIIRQLKILNRVFLTIQENLTQSRTSDMFPGSFDILDLKNVLESRVECISEISKADMSLYFEMTLIVSLAKATRRRWLETYRRKNRCSVQVRKGDVSLEDVELKLSDTGTIPRVFQNVAKLIHTLCCAYMRESRSYAEEDVKPNKTELDYLADLLPPDMCEDASEDHKPAVTLKSCVFKYVIIGALLSGNLPRCFTDETETDGTDVEAIVWVLEQIKKSKTLNHPVLGIPIQTFSLSYRGYVVAPRFMSRHVENRLSDVLYSFLDTLITTLKEAAEKECTNMKGTTNLNECTDLCEKASNLEKLGENDELRDGVKMRT